MEPFNLEAWLRKHCCWEDMESAVLIITTEDDGFEIMDYEGIRSGKGKTIAEACNEFDKK